MKNANFENEAHSFNKIVAFAKTVIVIADTIKYREIHSNGNISIFLCELYIIGKGFQPISFDRDRDRL